MKKNSHTFTNSKIQYEVEKKGFHVYDYISLKELMMTVQVDFLNVLHTLNIPLAIVSVVLGFISPILIIFFLPIAYFFIFLYIFVRLVGRTYSYILIRDVVYTTNGVVLGKEIFSYKQKKKLNERIHEYEKIFQERLSHPSRLKDFITDKRKKLTGKVLGNFKYVKKAEGKAAIALFFALLGYSLSIIFFYFLGILFGYIFFVLYAFFIKILLSFTDSVELKIKNKTAKIDESVKILEQKTEEIQKKLEEFLDGKISDISGYMEKNFKSVYLYIHSILKLRTNLEKIISKSRYQKLIDFTIFSGYLKKIYNNPIENMISFLQKTEENITKQIQNISGVDAAQVKKKTVHLEFLYAQVKRNKEKMQELLLL